MIHVTISSQGIYASNGKGKSIGSVVDNQHISRKFLASCEEMNRSLSYNHRIFNEVAELVTVVGRDHRSTIERSTRFTDRRSSDPHALPIDDRAIHTLYRSKIERSTRFTDRRSSDPHALPIDDRAIHTLYRSTIERSTRFTDRRSSDSDPLIHLIRNRQCQRTVAINESSSQCGIYFSYNPVLDLLCAL